MSDIGFGTTIAITAGSAILTGMVISKLIPKIHRPILVLTSGILMSGITFLFFLITTKAWQLYVLYFFLGIFNMMVNIPRTIIFLRDTTDNIRGQVMSAFNMVYSIDYILGLVYGLIFISIIGIRLLFFINGVICTLIALCGAIYLLSIKNLDHTSVQISEIKQNATPEAEL